MPDFSSKDSIIEAMYKTYINIEGPTFNSIVGKRLKRLFKRELALKHTKTSHCKKHTCKHL